MPKTVNRINSAARAIAVLLLAALMVMLFAVSGCGKARLSTPTGLNVNSLTLELGWNQVSEAAYYTIRIRGEGISLETPSSRNSYDGLKNLDAGEYTISVRAEPGANTESGSSGWSKGYTFVRDEESGLIMTAVNSDTAFEVSGMGTADVNVVIPDTYRGLPVVSIADRAFASQNTEGHELASVVIGGNVKTIGENAFSNCYSLSSVTLPEGLEEIGANAFQSCRRLTGTIKLPDSLTMLGERAFQYCGELTAIEIGSGLEEIGASAFGECDKLTKVDIPSTVKTIGSGAFFQCDEIATVTIGQGVTEIGQTAFSGCKKLSSLTIGDSVESIGNEAFFNCAALKSLTVPDSVKTIGAGAFNGCSLLSEATLGSGVESIGRHAFYNTAMWKPDRENYVDGWMVGAEYSDDSGVAEAPDEGTIGISDYAYSEQSVGGKTLVLPDSVKYIGSHAFDGCEDLLGIVIGSGAVSIGEYAFAGSGLSVAYLCAYDSSLTDHLGASSLKSIGSYAFSDCAGLTDIDIPSTVTSIGRYAFSGSGMWPEEASIVYAGNWIVGYNPSGLGVVITVQEGTAGIADYAFYNMTNIGEVRLPDSVKYIGRSAFNGCTNLMGISLPDGLREIADYAFYGCESLASLHASEEGVSPITLPSSITRIGRSAFYMCALGSSSSDKPTGDILVIPDSVTEIGDYAFYKSGFTYEDPDATGSKEDRLVDGGIDAIEIGSKVESIGAYAFYGMDSLKSISLNNVQNVGAYPFYKCEALADVDFGDSLKSIGERTFYGCAQLRSAALPSTVTEIGNYAFYKCEALADVDFGSAESIGDYAFYGCSGLKELSFPAQLKSIGRYAFKGCSSVKSILLGSSVQQIGAHAFYGCKDMTIYTDAAGALPGWNTHWNSSYCTIVWGSDISGGYLVKFVVDEGTVSYYSSESGLSAPEREGYRFDGFATESGGDAEYKANEIATVPAGTTLYAVWTKV